MVDCDWPHIPDELLQLGLTRLHLRFADFADGAPRCMQPLRRLTLPLLCARWACKLVALRPKSCRPPTGAAPARLPCRTVVSQGRRPPGQQPAGAGAARLPDQVQATLGLVQLDCCMPCCWSRDRATSCCAMLGGGASVLQHICRSTTPTPHPVPPSLHSSLLSPAPSLRCRASWQ